MQKKTLGLLLLFFLSRLIFINSGPVFFDSPEYLSRFAMPDFWQALVAGHAPFHAGYMLFGWPIYHLFDAEGVVVFQILLATFALWCFYQILKVLTHAKVALFASIIASLLPLWWIATSTIMMESLYSSLFLISWYLFIRFIQTKRWHFLGLSSILFGIAFLTHIAVLLWTPIFFLSIWLVGKKEKGELVKWGVVSVLASVGIAILCVALAAHMSLTQSTFLLFGSKTQERMQLTLSLTGIAVFVRNILIPALVNNTSLIILLSFISLVLLFRKNKKLFIFGALWIAPILLVDQWWDSLLFGRHALLASFGFAFLTGWLLQKRKAQLFVIGYSLLVSIPALMLLKQPIPYTEEAKALAKLPKESLVIESHFARPQAAGMYPGKTIFVNEPGEQTPLVPTIKQYLSQQKPVLITAQALSDPYGLYSGPYLHSLSLSYAHPPLLQGILKQFTIEHYKTISAEDNLVIYKIVADKPAPYPKIKKLQRSRRRIDYFDPIMQVVFWLEK